MPSFAEGTTNITVYAEIEMKAALKKRAELMGWTTSRVVHAILDAWMRAGQPPIHKVDAILLDHASQLMGEKPAKKLPRKQPA